MQEQYLKLKQVKDQRIEAICNFFNLQIAELQMSTPVVLVNNYYSAVFDICCGSIRTPSSLMLKMVPSL